MHSKEITRILWSKQSKLLAIFGFAILAFAMTSVAQAKTQKLPDDISALPDKLIKYEHLKNQRASNGQRYDIKVQYGRASRKSGGRKGREAVRKMIAFTRVLISKAGENDYRKPSADRLSELFPGSFVYTSINGSQARRNNQPVVSLIDPDSCAKKKWHKSRQFTTFVKMQLIICTKRGFDSGHRAKIGDKMLVDTKL
ncbi:MAG: hypothetical protein AAF850_04760 [Pseudomonadota bacterium]